MPTTRSSPPTPETALLQGPLLVVAPHPDDESLGAGGLISDACARGIPVWVVFVTSGDAFPWSLPHALGRLWRGGRALRDLGEERMHEARLATARLGVHPDHVVFLGFPDRGMTALASSHRNRPYRSPATATDRVPYPDAFRPGAPYTGSEVVRQLHEIIELARPATILTPGPIDSHGDHRAITALVRDVWNDHDDLELVYYLVHFGPDWPSPKGWRPTQPLRPPAAYGTGARWVTHVLASRHLRLKREAIGAYTSQLRVMSWTLWSFLRPNELLLPVRRDVRSSVSRGAPWRLR